MKTIIHNEQDIKNLQLENEYTEKNLFGMLELMNELIKLGIPCYIETDLDYHGQIILDKEQDIRMSNINYKKEYSIFSYKTYPYINYDNQLQLIKDIKQPNNFKVLNKKTIQKWIDYYKEVNEVYKGESLRLACKVSDYLLKVDTLAKEKGLELSMSEDNKSGRLTSTDFKLVFSISDNGYISEDVRLNEWKKDFNLFTKLI